MCFSPQRRAIFRHQNFKKCSGHAVFCTFWLVNVLFATAACIFPTSELQKVLRACGVLCILTSTCAFRHSGAGCNFSTSELQKVLRYGQFFTFWLGNVHFATAPCKVWFFLSPHDSAPAALTGLLFDWPDTRIIEKTQHVATSLTFGADVSSFFWLSRYGIFFLLTWLLYSAFQLSILSEVRLLNFLR